MKNTAKTNKANKASSGKKNSIKVKNSGKKLADKVEFAKKNPKNIGSFKELKEKIFQKIEYHEEINPEMQATEAIGLTPDKIITFPEDTVGHEKIQQNLQNKNSDPEFIDQKNRVEAVLFASGKYLPEESISELCGMDKRSTRKALETLQKDYDSKNTSLMVFEDNKNWKINVREKYLSLVRKIVADTEFSKSIMETLAVIAWKSPVSQSEVIKIRGNKAYDHIASLEDSGFVNKVKKGRSYILKTTDKFYTYFDIDQKNLKGVMEEIKIPEKQATLEEPAIQEIDKETMLRNIENISVKRIAETEDEKIRNKEFLNQIDGKIKEASERTSKYDEEIPKPMHAQESQTQEIPLEITDQTAHSELPAPSETEISNQTTSSKLPASQSSLPKPEEYHKPKSLTKKQLEKKFKDDLLRVRDKMKK